MLKQVKFIMPLRMFALLCVLFFAVGAYAQNITVNGHVKDATGEPVIGATVSIGEKTAAITDFDGNFTLQAAPGTELSVTYVGYTTQKVKAAPIVIVVLQDDSKTLEQVVVIGYGRAKKNDLTGSVTAMKPDELSKGITNNASDMLVGKVAGVDVQTAGGTPGAGAQIRIRGGASMSASNDPLYVIDGLQIDPNTATGMSNILAMINPADIESFTVLKDASATAIYGSRASNGVIIITTKKGRAGARPTVTYNADVTLSQIQKKYDVLNAAQYKEVVSSIEGLDVTKLGDADTNWQDQIFRKAFSTNHNVSVQGGLKNMPYRVSAGYNLSNGIVKTSWMQRANASVNVAPTFFDKHLNVNATAKFMYEKDRYADAGGAIGAALSLDPTRPVYGEGDDYKFTGGYWQYLVNPSDKMNSSWRKTTNNNAPQNPVALLNQQNKQARSNDFSGNLEVDYKIHGFEDLHIHASLGGQYTKSEQTNSISRYSYGSNYYGWDGVMNYNKYSLSGNAYAQYMKEVGAHNFDIMAGAEQSHYHRHGNNEVGYGTDAVSGEIYADGQVKLEDAGVRWATHNSLVSYFGRFNYSLLDRYMLTATFRADGSSRFADGKKWGYFPSLALAWKVNNEAFLKDMTWLDELKVRAGWGKTGQQNLDQDFYYMPLYVGSNSHAQYPFGDNYQNTTRPNSYNSNLTWEKTMTLNAGIDFMAMNGRFSVNLDAYYRKTDDLLSWVNNLAFTNFGDTSLQNIGSLKNYGVEVAFNVKPIVTKDFTWDVSYNLGWNHNEITALNANGNDYVWGGTTISRGNNTRIMHNKVGQPVNSFFVYQQVYDEAGKPIEGLYVDRNADGQINDADRYYYKSPAAPVTMGLTSKFLYKNFDLSLAFHASIGNYVYYDFLANKAIVSAGGLYSNSTFSNITPEAVELGFTGTTTVQNYLSDYFVRNASYIKCSNITVGYTFPALLTMGTQKLMSGRVFATVQNPFIITKYKGLDPEVSSGVDSNPYPRPMSFQLGVNFNF